MDYRQKPERPWYDLVSDDQTAMGGIVNVFMAVIVVPILMVVEIVVVIPIMWMWSFVARR